jgi:hypothetical protein
VPPPPPPPLPSSRFAPTDATTNPSLLLKAATMPQYAHLLEEAVAFAKASGLTGQDQLDLAMYCSVARACERAVCGCVRVLLDLLCAKLVVRVFVPSVVLVSVTVRGSVPDPGRWSPQDRRSSDHSHCSVQLAPTPSSH